jgi:stearoyl-CoA desaturase (delta-9 desaturase)
MRSFLRKTAFLGFHCLSLLALYTGVSAGSAIFCFIMCFMMMFGVTAGYHRYLSHRTFKTSRLFQAILALMGTLSLQKGNLWWAANHRDHHRYSDEKEDIHSPIQKGFWWSHIGWILSTDHEHTRWEKIKDFAKFPELVWLNTYWLGVYIAMCVIVLLTLGLQYLVWGCFIATLISMHITFSVNSLLHLWGRRTYKTADQSRNNYFLAILTLGEGFHNNHHYYPASAAQGFHWWQIDITYYILWMLQKVGIVWGLRKPSQQVKDGYLRKGGECKLITKDTQLSP